MCCGESGPKLGKCWNNADNSGHPLLTMLLVENAHGLPHDRSENMLSRLPWDSLRLSTSSEEKLKTRFWSPWSDREVASNDRPSKASFLRSWQWTQMRYTWVLPTNEWTWLIAISIKMIEHNYTRHKFMCCSERLSLQWGRFGNFHAPQTIWDLSAVWNILMTLQL